MLPSALSELSANVPMPPCVPDKLRQRLESRHAAMAAKRQLRARAAETAKGSGAGKGANTASRCDADSGLPISTLLELARKEQEVRRTYTLLCVLF